MTPEEEQLGGMLQDARIKLKRLTSDGSFPELQTSIMGLSKAINALESNQTMPADGPVEQATDSVNRLYRTSMAQANAIPQKYQQPIFQCYGDYQKCMAKQTSPSGKALCVTLFVLSIADNLISLSIEK